MKLREVNIALKLLRFRIALNVKLEYFILTSYLRQYPHYRRMCAYESAIRMKRDINRAKKLGVR